MLSISQPVDSTHISLGERRGISDLARVALDLARAPGREDPYTVATSPAYPSPPMSGSSPLPSRAAQDVGGRDPPPGGYPSLAPEDAYRVNSNIRKPTEHRGMPNMAPSLPSLFQQETSDRMAYSYPRPEDALSRPPPYHPAGAPGMTHQQNYLPMGGPSAGSAYPVPTRPMNMENQQISSPKSQRKTKGHVASACVPCKRAHLRCDAQRPCSRCLTNGKEESCVDVQHKKRGRPRLRDDRDTRFDPSRFPHPQDATLRRPLSIYPSGSSMSAGEHLTPRFSNRTSPSDLSVNATTSSSIPLPPEPVAFLNMKLEITKVSSVFVDAIGGGKVQGRNLTDIVSPFDQHKLEAIRNKLHESQTRQEPNYLPPILDSLDQFIQRLGFTSEDIGRFQLEYSHYLKFIAHEGWREYRVQIGLAKEGSIYFVVLLLDVHDPYSWKPSWKSRETPMDASRMPAAQPPTSLPTYAHSSHSTMSDQSRQGFSEGSFGPRPPPGSMTQNQSDASPGGGAQVRSYSASPSHAQYPGPSPSYHIPRSELSPVARLPPQPAYQLPPIRAQPEQPGNPGTHPWPREDRPNRVDIGGLIDKPDASGWPR